MQIQVECYSGHRGEETPRCFWMSNSKVEVKTILDMWLAPEHRYFKFVGNDDSVYIIRHDINKLEWQLTFFRHSDTPHGISFQDYSQPSDLLS